MGTEVLLPAQTLGSTRSITEIFILLRNNATQSKHMFPDSRKTSDGASNLSEDRLSLIPLDDGSNVANYNAKMPPEWVNIVDEVQYEILRVENRMKDLNDLQQRHVNQPSFTDEKSQDERTIEIATAEITKMLSHCHKLVQLIQSSGPNLSKDSRLRTNVVTSLIQHLQNVTMEFKANQTVYLNRLRNRQDNCEKFFFQFETPIPGGSSGSSTTTALPSFFNDEKSSFNDNFTTPTAAENCQISMKQLQILEENVSMAREREREIFNITKSIMEINHLFKDLASFIVDQGTVLDRIDYNIEQSNVRVKSALKSVKKAEDYQKKSRKMWCIMTLAIVIIVLLILLIIVKA